MTKGIARKQQLAEQRRKRAQTAAGLALGAKSPARPIPVPSAAKRASVGLAPHRYPAKRASLGLRQVPLEAVAPLGRADK
jgi:hypothetical protein